MKCYQNRTSDVSPQREYNLSFSKCRKKILTIYSTNNDAIYRSKYFPNIYIGIFDCEQRTKAPIHTNENKRLSY